MSSYKVFLQETIKLNNNISWDFAREKKEKNFSLEENELLNNIAFSFISNDEKRNLYELLINHEINSIKIDSLFSFFSDHFLGIKFKYPIEKELLENFCKKMIEWTNIIDDEICQSVFLENIKSSNNEFLFYIIKELYNNKKFNLTLSLINQVKPQFKSDTLYQDIILYEIFCIRKTDYLYKNKSIKLLHSLLKEITSYTSVKVLLELEVALLRDDMSEFNKVFNKNENFIKKQKLSMLLNFYELSVYSQMDHICVQIKDFIKNHDIDSYKDEKEFSIYNLFRLINNYIKDNSLTNRGEILKSLHILKKYQKTFDFEHLNWFLRKKNDMELLRFIDQIVN